MKINHSVIKFSHLEPQKPLVSKPDVRPILAAQDKTFHAPKIAGGKPVMKLVKKGPDAGQYKAETIRISLQLRMVEVGGTIYRTTSRSSTITREGQDGAKDLKLTPPQFYRTAVRLCGEGGGRNALLHLLISDALLAVNPLN